MPCVTAHQRHTQHDRLDDLHSLEQSNARPGLVGVSSDVRFPAPPKMAPGNPPSKCHSVDHFLFGLIAKLRTRADQFEIQQRGTKRALRGWKRMPAEQVSAYAQIVGQQSTGPERLPRRGDGKGESPGRQGRSKHPSRIRIKPPATVLRWTHGNIGAVLKPSDDGRQPARRV